MGALQTDFIAIVMQFDRIDIVIFEKTPINGSLTYVMFSKRGFVG